MSNKLELLILMQNNLNTLKNTLKSTKQPELKRDLYKQIDQLKKDIKTVKKEIGYGRD